MLAFTPGKEPRVQCTQDTHFTLLPASHRLCEEAPTPPTPPQTSSCHHPASSAASDLKHSGKNSSSDAKSHCLPGSKFKFKLKHGSYLLASQAILPRIRYFFQVKQLEAQRGWVIFPRPHSQDVSAGIIKQ